jgi:hypothetical protein
MFLFQRSFGTTVGIEGCGLERGRRVRVTELAAQLTAEAIRRVHDRCFHGQRRLVASGAMVAGDEMQNARHLVVGELAGLGQSVVNDHVALEEVTIEPTAERHLEAVVAVLERAGLAEIVHQSAENDITQIHRILGGTHCARLFRENHSGFRHFDEVMHQSVKIRLVAVTGTRRRHAVFASEFRPRIQQLRSQTTEALIFDAVDQCVESSFQRADVTLVGAQWLNALRRV